MGALHPVLFFIFIYGISLVLALFICKTVFEAINGTETSTVQAEEKNLDYAAAADFKTAALRQ
jgi:hypothetical protein